MNSRSILHSLGALLCLASTALAGPISITITSNGNGGSSYADAYGNLLAAGSVIRIGQFDLSQPANLTLLQTSDDYLAVDALFTPLAESLFNAGTVTQTGALGQQIVINDLFGLGHVFGQIGNIEETYFQAGTPLYAWVFNSNDPLTATEWGIFSSTTRWGFPISPGSETLATFEIDNIIRGYDTASMLTLAPVPEPGSIVLVLLGMGALFFRVRRASHPVSTLS